MDVITGYLTANPALFKTIVIFVLIVIAYFIFKQFLKLSLVLLLIVLAVAGYYYFQDPKKMSAKFKESIDTVQSGSDQVIKKSKSIYNDSQELIDQTKKVPEDVNKFFKGSEDKAGK